MATQARPLASLGYKQALQFLRGELDRESALAAAQQAHRNYAKRQITWFRREPDVRWLAGFGDDAGDSGGRRSRRSNCKFERVREREHWRCEPCEDARSAVPVAWHFFAIVNGMLRHLLFVSCSCCLPRRFARLKTRAKTTFCSPVPSIWIKPGRKWADKTLRKMSPEEKVGQLFAIWVRVQFLNDADPIFIQLRDSIRKYHIGSLVMSVPVDGAGPA